MRLPSRCVVDTNVPKTANHAINPDKIPDELVDCVLECVETIEHIRKTRGLILDSDGQIFNEYRKQLSMSGQPGPGDAFIKWIHDNMGNFPHSNFVKLTKESFDLFSRNKKLRNFDQSDRKFVAVSNSHPQKPAIVQGTDSKWWGWKDGLLEEGIDVIFLCPQYIQAKYKKKIQKTRNGNK